MEPQDSIRLCHKVRSKFRKGVRDFCLIAPDDHILVGLSGGKDSLALLELLGEYRRHSNHSFQVTALHVRMENVDYRTDIHYLEEKAKECGADFLFRVFSFEADRNAKRTPCFLCSWNRRKILFETAQELRCNKIALGHHQDDILHTALMNLSFAGSFSTMPVSMQMRKFQVKIIRPLCLVQEADLRAWAELHSYEPMQKECPFSEASQRSNMRELLGRLEQLSPEFRYSLWHALQKEGKLVEE